MALKSIIRATGGSAEREVQVADIVIRDIRALPLFLPDERWIGAVERYYEDLGLLLGAARADLELPSEFFVPDLWHTAIKLPPEESESMLDMWHLGSELALALGYETADLRDFIRNGVGGTVFVRSALR